MFGTVTGMSGSVTAGNDRPGSRLGTVSGGSVSTTSGTDTDGGLGSTGGFATPVVAAGELGGGSGSLRSGVEPAWTAGFDVVGDVVGDALEPLVVEGRADGVRTAF
jgi:hypothetical protein